MLRFLTITNSCPKQLILWKCVLTRKRVCVAHGRRKARPSRDEARCRQRDEGFHVSIWLPVLCFEVKTEIASSRVLFLRNYIRIEEQVVQAAVQEVKEYIQITDHECQLSRSIYAVVTNGPYGVSINVPIRCFRNKMKETIEGRRIGGSSPHTFAASASSSARSDLSEFIRRQDTQVEGL